mgnify:CR=1 FL=1
MKVNQNCLLEAEEAAVIHIETTGPSPTRDRLVAVYVLIFDFHTAAKRKQIQGRKFNALLNPIIPIPPEATEVHGVRNQDVWSKETFSDIAYEFSTFVGNRPLVGYNANVIMDFLDSESERAGTCMLSENHIYCIKTRFREHMEALYGVRSYNWTYGDLLDEIGIRGQRRSPYAATEDVLLTAKAASLFYLLDNNMSQNIRPGSMYQWTSTGKRSDVSKAHALLHRLSVGRVLIAAITAIVLMFAGRAL